MWLRNISQHTIRTSIIGGNTEKSAKRKTLYMSNKDLIIIKSPLDNVMQGVFEDTRIGVLAKGRIYEFSSDMKKLSEIAFI